MILSVVKYIDTHLGDNLSLRHLARMAGCSPFFFHRIFQEQTGCRPKAYVDKARLKKAQALLAKGYTTAAVAAEIGISTPYSFNRFFKRQLIASPADWRASQKIGV